MCKIRILEGGKSMNNIAKNLSFVRIMIATEG